MRILPKTIKEGGEVTITSLEVKVTDEIVETAVNIELKPGSFSLHDAYVIHGSEPNRSSDFRKNYTMHYADADTTKFRPEKWRIPFFLVRGQAKNLTSYIDIRPHQSLPNQQPDCQPVKNLKKIMTAKSPALTKSLLTKSTNSQTFL